MIGLGDLFGGDFYSFDFDASGNGSVVVDWSDSGGPPNHENAAFVWDQINGMRSVRSILSDAGVEIIGWWIERGTGISDDGTIITCYGDNLDGYTEAWIADISGSVQAAVPVPGAIWLFGPGLLGLDGISRYKKQHKDFI